MWSAIIHVPEPIDPETKQQSILTAATGKGRSGAQKKLKPL